MLATYGTRMGMRPPSATPVVSINRVSTEVYGVPPEGNPSTCESPSTAEGALGMLQLGPAAELTVYQRANMGSRSALSVRQLRPPTRHVMNIRQPLKPSRTKHRCPKP